MAARRRVKHDLISPAQIGGISAIGGFLALLGSDPDFVTRLVLIAALVGGAWIWIRMAWRKRSHDHLMEKLSTAMQSHEAALISYFYQSRREDQFGNVDDSRWQTMINTFLRTQVVSGVIDFAQWRAGKIGQQAAKAVDDFTRLRISEGRAANPLAHVEASSLTPTEYERHCGDLLRERGWQIRMTPPTRDGGADFIAEKGPHRLVVQCKRYSQPVGNKAVQEVNSAVRLYNGNLACVVAPSGFTAQAQREAHGLSIHLLHHSSLQTFADMLEASEERQEEQ